RAGSGDEDSGRERAAGRVEQPQLGVLVPRRGGHLVAEEQVRADAVLDGAAAQVVLDLGLAREGPAPPWVRREGERVEVRGDVALAAGIGVVAPRSADVVGALEHDEVVDALMLEADRYAQPRESAA